MVFGTSAGFFACGSRTALPGDFDAVGSGDDDSSTADVRRPRDTGPDTNPPPIDARPPVDANRDDCPDADATLVYLITEQNQLLSFFPTDGTFHLIGNISCPANPGETPFSMAVDRKGVAYVEFSDGELFKVSTATAACVKTSYVSLQHGFYKFGMGFSTNGAGPSETLFMAGDDEAPDPNNPSVTGSTDLGSLDVNTFKVTDIGDFSAIANGELAGTGDGRLFTLWATDRFSDINISQVDKTNAAIIATDPLPGVELGTAWAFGYWGGKFYTFTAPDVGTDVHEFDPVTKAVRLVATYPQQIVGAGVSTCAPQE